jgi:hypothetical protein
LHGGIFGVSHWSKLDKIKGVKMGSERNSLKFQRVQAMMVESKKEARAGGKATNNTYLKGH